MGDRVFQSSSAESFFGARIRVVLGDDTTGADP
jgi:hypothetical protein